MGRAGPASLARPKPRLGLEQQQADTLCDQGEMWGHEQGSLAGCAPALQRPGGMAEGVTVQTAAHGPLCGPPPGGAF